MAIFLAWASRGERARFAAPSRVVAKKVVAISTLEEEFQAFVRVLGERIRSLRKAKKYSQMYISEKAGIYDVGTLERGQAGNPTLYTLFVLARSLNIELKELLDLSPGRESAGESERILIEVKSALEDQDLPTQRKALHLLQVLLAEYY